jgi:hypothetical protein
MPQEMIRQRHRVVFASSTRPSYNVSLEVPRRLANHRVVRWSLAFAALTLVTGCARRDVRPWMVCYRIYDQCKERIGALAQSHCEVLVAKQPPAVVDALVDCVRDRPCPGIARVCVKAHAPSLAR